MSKTIIVEAKGKKIQGTVADTAVVNLAGALSIETKIETGTSELLAILNGEVEDPTKKRCLRCAKLGRPFMHDLDDFSTLKNGEKHSQCKVCRVEQTMEYQNARKEERKLYHREYHKRRPKRQPVNHGVKALQALYEEQENATNQVDASEALFVGFATIDIQETN